MPKIRRSKLPPLLLDHLLKRAKERHISYDQMQQMYRWLASDITVPEGRWFKRFPDFIICGEGELIKTFLIPGQLADGEEIF